MNRLEHRILDISYRHKLGHIGSCLTTLPILEYIYAYKAPEDKVVLSNGHAGIALYAVLEKTFGYDAESLFLQHGIHPNRNIAQRIEVSTGSLGLGILIAVGLALGEPAHNVYCVVSDGELAEGSCYEALMFASQHHLRNLHVHVNMNGWSAYGQVDEFRLQNLLANFSAVKRVWETDISKYWFLQGLNGHYHVMTKEEYEAVIHTTTV